MVFRIAVAVVIVGASGICAGMLASGQPEMNAMPSFGGLPKVVADWRSEDYTTDETTERVLAADATLGRHYIHRDGTEIWLFLAYFAHQQVNAQIHSPRNCIPGGGWTITATQQGILELNGVTRPVTRMRIVRKGLSQDIIYWFSTCGKTTGNEYALKWEQLKNSVLRRPTNAVFVRYGAASADTAALRELIALLDGRLREVLGEVGLQ